MELIYTSTGLPVEIGDAVTLPDGATGNVVQLHKPNSGLIQFRYDQSGVSRFCPVASIGAQWVGAADPAPAAPASSIEPQRLAVIEAAELVARLQEQGKSEWDDTLYQAIRALAGHAAAIAKLLRNI